LRSREAWNAAAPAAVQFWQRAARDRRISKEFRAICERNATLVDEARAHA